jgi:hypothetical protein
MKRKLQQLIGKINFITRFISNLSGGIEPFMNLVKIKADEEFHWGAEQQRAFEEIKEYLARPPVLVPPSGTSHSTFICQWAMPPSPQWWYKCMRARKRLCFTSVGKC